MTDHVFARFAPRKGRDRAPWYVMVAGAPLRDGRKQPQVRRFATMSAATKAGHTARRYRAQFKR